MAKKKTTEQLRKQAIKDIDKRLNGDATPAKRKAAAKKKPSSKTSTKKVASQITAKATKTTNTPRKKKPRKPSGLDAAAQVLAKAKEPMRCKDIVGTMLGQGLWSTSGKTPHATIYAAIIREISKKGKNARFKKTDRGLFTVNPVKKGA